MGFNKRTNFKFIIPCISNCAVELFTGRNDDGDARGDIHVNKLTIERGYYDPKISEICYLDTPYNPSYFYKVNPQSHKALNTGKPDGIEGALVDSGTIGGLGKDRPYSYALIKDCILNFDRLYNNDADSANKR